MTMRLWTESGAAFQALFGFMARPAKTVSFLQTLSEENSGES